MSFDPKQPRDKTGEWMSSAGADAKSAKAEKSSTEALSADAKVFDVINHPTRSADKQMEYTRAAGRAHLDAAMDHYAAAQAHSEVAAHAKDGSATRHFAKAEYHNRVADEHNRVRGKFNDASRRFDTRRNRS